MNRPKVKMKPTHYVNNPESPDGLLIFELTKCEICGEPIRAEDGLLMLPELGAMGLDLQQYEPGVPPPS